MAVDVLNQTLDPPVNRGEDATVALTGTFSSSPAAWATRFSIARDPGDTPATVTPPAPVVTGPTLGSYSATWTLTVPSATTAALKAGLNVWELARTDTGSREVLACGTWLVLDGVTTYP